MRSDSDMIINPCRFVIKNISSDRNAIKSIVVEDKDGNTITKVKKIVQKKDENGNPIFKEEIVERKKGCGCKGKAQEIVKEVKKIAVTEEIWVDVEEPQQVQMADDEYIVCKLYGKVKKHFCQRCTTYKKV